MNDKIGILKSAKRLIANSANWVQGTWKSVTKDQNGNVSARKFCLVGAICYAAGVPPMLTTGQNDAFDETLEYLAGSLKGSEFESPERWHRQTLMTFNDYIDTKHSDVIKLLTEAIEKGEC